MGMIDPGCQINRKVFTYYAKYDSHKQVQPARVIGFKLDIGPHPRVKS